MPLLLAVGSPVGAGHDGEIPGQAGYDGDDVDRSSLPA